MNDATSNDEMANRAWERFNPDKVSIPKHDAEGSTWRSGYLAALQDYGVQGCLMPADADGVNVGKFSTGFTRASTLLERIAVAIMESDERHGLDVGSYEDLEPGCYLAAAAAVIEALRKEGVDV